MDEKRLYKDIGVKIKKLREDYRYNQIDLAKKLGLERTSISNIENGKQNLSIILLYKICVVFKVSIDDLLPNPKDLIQRNLVTENSGNVNVGSKTLSVIQAIRDS